MSGEADIIILLSVCEPTAGQILFVDLRGNKETIKTRSFERDSNLDLYTTTTTHRGIILGEISWCLC